MLFSCFGIKALRMAETFCPLIMRRTVASITLPIRQHRCLAIQLHSGSHGAAFALSAAVLLSAFVAPTQAAEQALSIVSWNVHGVLPKLVNGRLEQPKSVWRNTFGPRDGRSELPQLPAPMQEADIVALQGISAPAIVRWLFPVRKYLLLFTRAAARPAPVSPSSSRTNTGLTQSWTAIAVRRSRQVRILARDTVRAFVPSGANAQLIRTRIADTAVRVRVRGRAVWVLSVNLADGCRQGLDSVESNADICRVQAQQLKVLAAWLETKRRKKEAAIVAGGLNRDFQVIATGVASVTPWQLLSGHRAKQQLREAHAQKGPLPGQTMKRKTSSPPGTNAEPSEAQGWLGSLLARITGQSAKRTPVTPSTTAGPLGDQQQRADKSEKSKEPSQPKMYGASRLLRFPAAAAIANCKRNSPFTLDHVLVAPATPDGDVGKIAGRVLPAVALRSTTAGIAEIQQKRPPKLGACPLLVTVPLTALNKVKVYRRPVHAPEPRAADPLPIGRPY